MNAFKKLVVLLIIAAICGLGALIDYFISLSYTIDFVSVERLVNEGDEDLVDVFSLWHSNYAPLLIYANLLDRILT